MCGRYTETKNIKDLEAQFQAQGLIPEWTPRYNIAPMQNAPVAVVMDGARMIQLMRWGLVPFWAKDETPGYKMINARAETLREKPSFRRGFERQRCLVIADGYYEWRKAGRAKEPFLFVLKTGEPFAMAGLWDRWPPNGLETFIVITTAANDLVKPVHDRMPVMLDPEHYQPWLDPQLRDTAILEKWLSPYPPEKMRAFRVSALVNSPAHEGPQCIEPVREPGRLPGMDAGG